MTTTSGASAAAIQFHYDIGNDFYQLWLDKTCSYSSALWGENDKTLEEAQNRKIDYHIEQSKASDRVLDIGCGWGGVLTRLSQNKDIKEGVGLTLSQAQLDWINALQLPKTRVSLESWADYKPKQPFNSIISIGAFEHFVNLEQNDEEKAATYKKFFQTCWNWLEPDGSISLQTIIYERANISNSSSFLAKEIFPESNLPHLHEILKASEGLFEIVTLRNDRKHYERTLHYWLKNLRANRAQAVDLVGEKVVKKYEHYFGICMIAFHSAALNLSRITFKRINEL